MQYFFWSKCIGYLCMFPNDFFIYNQFKTQSELSDILEKIEFFWASQGVWNENKQYCTHKQCTWVPKDSVTITATTFKCYMWSSMQTFEYNLENTENYEESVLWQRKFPTKNVSITRHGVFRVAMPLLDIVRIHSSQWKSVREISIESAVKEPPPPQKRMHAKWNFGSNSTEYLIL